ncbi:MAG: hypothetical protein L0215_25865 [Gemmataceae bacterium]|nr:hypothetical protein [Gemmataceae bacterium]
MIHPFAIFSQVISCWKCKAESSMAIVMENNNPLYSVEFVLNVEGHGLTALCCFPDPAKAIVRQGDDIEFIRPDKSVFRTRVKALSIIHTRAGSAGLIGLVVPESVKKDDIPYGSFLRLVVNENLE